MFPLQRIGRYNVHVGTLISKRISAAASLFAIVWLTVYPALAATQCDCRQSVQSVSTDDVTQPAATPACSCCRSAAQNTSKASRVRATPDCCRDGVPGSQPCDGCRCRSLPSVAMPTIPPSLPDAIAMVQWTPVPWIMDLDDASFPLVGDSSTAPCSRWRDVCVRLNRWLI